MAISPTLRKFLTDNAIGYDVLPHSPTATSLNSADAAHIPGNKMAKSVILEDEDGYLMAVIPANEHIKIRELNHTLNRNMGLATEMELHHLFTDCVIGAIPPVGMAYGVKTVVDDRLLQCDDVYFEAGDHEELIHVKGALFRKMMEHSQHTNLCTH
jgi:Ala-tRNA(Pro) deacylase